MHYNTLASILATIAVAVALPQLPPRANMPGLAHGASLTPSTACFCCPPDVGNDDNCSLVSENGRCIEDDVLSCCDFLKLSCQVIGTIKTEGATDLLDLSTTLNSILGISL